MPSFPGGLYAPPGVYTRTLFEDPTQPLLAGIKLPMLIGTGSEILTQSDLEVVRGSSSQVDQRIVQEDETGRAVVSISTTGVVTLGAFDGVRDRIQVRNYPIVTGQGTGTTATNTSAVSVTINGQPIVVLQIDGEKGVLKLSTPPALGDVVKVTYFFNREDTRITDTVSDQVTTIAAILRGAIGQSYEITTDVNDTFIFTVDDETEITVTIPPSTTDWTASQIAAFINAAAASTTLVASTYTTNFGTTAVLLTADRNILMGNGSANSTLGFTNGDYTARNKVFVTFQGPIVDGTNGGVTTTDPSDVVVKVDGVQVIPTAVDGSTRQVTLPFAPEVGSVVTIQYYFNSWQNTFDYLAHTDVTAVTRCGSTPDRSDFVQDVDFVLQNDHVLWGTAVTVASGVHTTGTTYFDSATSSNGGQITPTLVDVRQYLAPCTPVTDTTVSPPVTSKTNWVLPLVPTTGNGRDTPLGSSLFQTVSNGRIDLPTDRPDLVQVYWGFGVQDAIERGAVTVTAVDSATLTVTLQDPVPVGASVYASFYYNTIQDVDYTLAVDVPGASGVGTYTVSDADGNSLLTAQFGTKSVGLTGITVQFPSGSERTPDARFETPFTTTNLTGAVEEDVTVTFASVDGTLAKFTVKGSGDYAFIQNASDRMRLLIDGVALAGGAAGLDLGTPLAGVANLGFFATMLGDEIEYAADSGYTTYEIDATNNGVNLTVDGVLLSASAATGAAVTLANFVTALNTAAAATAPQYVAAGQFLSSTVLTAGEYNELIFRYTGDVAGSSGDLTAAIAAATYASASTLATAVQAAMTTQIAGLGVGFAGLAVVVTANADGRLVFALTNATGDASGYLEFITHGTPASDFAVLAGIDTAAAGGAQTKLIDGPIARRFTITGDNTSALLHDRLILRSRLCIGRGTIYPATQMDYAGITVQGSSGDSLTGLTAQEFALAGPNATVRPATLLGVVGFSDGQVATGTYADARDGQPVVTFYADGGTTAQNNVFKFTMDGTPVTVEFTDAAGVAIATGSSADVPLGPAGTANTVLNQIRAAMTAAGLSSVTSRAIQEGGAIRLLSLLSTEASSIVIGTASANTRLGFADEASASRTLVKPKEVASAMMAHSGATVSTTLNSWTTPSNTYFADEALAWIERDDSNAEYLFIQSQGDLGLGTQSSVAFAAATADDVLLPGTGLDNEAGDGATGEEGISGFYVTSTDSVNGSGTINTSVLNPSNDGTGQDGIVGQTYRDLVTGLTFTVLPRSGGGNYPATSSFTFNVRRVVTTDSNIPIRTIPGIELLVTNTQGIGAGDTAIVTTFQRSGNEPAIGDSYFVTYNYLKQDFSAKLWTKFADIVAEYGANTPDNPVTLASYLAMLNGAVLIGIKQVQKDIDENNDGVNDSASVTAFIDAVDSLEGPLPGNVLPNILVPLDVPSSSTTEFFAYIARHADIQSLIRHRAERTVVSGFPAGTLPRTAGDTAQAIARSRLRLVYPDGATLSLTSAEGIESEFIVDGTMLAAALVGMVLSPSRDVATPWANKKLFGFNQLIRTLDPTTQNQTAIRGITIIEDAPPALKVRHGLTTEMTNMLTKLPTIIQIADEVQQQARVTLDRFVGIKFLPGVLSQIEGQLSTMLKLLVDAEILKAYTGVKANVAADDPTVAEVQAFYQPVFPLLYLVVTFHLRSQL